MTYLDLVIIGIGIVCAGELGWLMARQERLAKVLEIQLNGLSDTHMLGFEALTNSIARVEARVKAVEDEVL
jgi:hypothetical protein